MTKHEHEWKLQSRTSVAHGTQETYRCPDCREFKTDFRPRIRMVDPGQPYQSHNYNRTISR